MRDYKDDMKPFLKKFCSMHLFQRFVERDLYPKSIEDQWECSMFKKALKGKQKNVCCPHMYSVVSNPELQDEKQLETEANVHYCHPFFDIMISAR
jgi:hypothetical protein